MVKTADLFPTFTTTAEEAGQQGGQFDQSFGFLQSPAEVKGVGEATKLPRDILLDYGFIPNEVIESKKNKVIKKYGSYH